MSFKKRKTPEDAEVAQTRINGMNSIEENLDFGSGVSVTSLTAAKKTVTDKVSLYNTKLVELDVLGNDIKTDTKVLKDLNSRALKAAEFKFGKDSNEYEMMGGTRSSERKKSGKKTSPKP